MLAQINDIEILTQLRFTDDTKPSADYVTALIEETEKNVIWFLQQHVTVDINNDNDKYVIKIATMFIVASFVMTMLSRGNDSMIKVANDFRTIAEDAMKKHVEGKSQKNFTFSYGDSNDWIGVVNKICKN